MLKVNKGKLILLIAGVLIIIIAGIYLVNPLVIETLFKKDDPKLWDLRLEEFNDQSDNLHGNTPGNITNHAMAACKGDWIVYSNANDGDKLY